MVKFYESLAEDLILYARQIAWLNTAPQKAEGDKSAQVARRAILADKFGMDDPDMPDCNDLHLIEYLFEIGPVLSGGMGEAPLNHAEIDAWQRNTGINLTAWEARTLRRLSASYLAEMQASAQADRPSPWPEAPYQDLPSAMVALSMKQSMRKLREL